MEIVLEGRLEINEATTLSKSDCHVSSGTNFQLFLERFKRLFPIPTNDLLCISAVTDDQADEFAEQGRS